jgi:purine-binding chemotaxis protein CheW
LEQSDVDILKARKKAAERKQERKKKPIEPPVAEPIQGEPAPLEAVVAPALQAPEVPTSVTILPAREEPGSESPGGDDAGEQQVEELEFLTFSLGEEAYAIPVKDVREVLRVRTLTQVPNAPAHILGVTSLRGAVLPVIELSTRLGLIPEKRNEKSRIVVVGTDEEDVGLVVDRVLGVLRVLPEAIKPTPENIVQGAAYLSGIARKDDKLYILLDLAKVVEA